MEVRPSANPTKNKSILTNIPPSHKRSFWDSQAHYCSLEGSLSETLKKGGVLGISIYSFLIALKMVLLRRHYKAAVVDSNTSGNMFALLQSLIYLGKIRTVMIDCLWYRAHHPVKRFLKRLQMRIEAKSVTYFIVWASHEVHDYAKDFGIPEAQLLFIPFHTTIEDYEFTIQDGEYIFSGGNGDRDYATLVKAVKQLDIPVIIATTNLKAFKSEPIPSNVTIQACDHTGFRQLMAGARIVVVPMEGELLHSGGQQTYLNAMAMGKPVIVCDSKGAKDYIELGKEGIILDYADNRGLEQALKYLIKNPESAAEMGEAAQNRIQHGSYTTKDCLQKVIDVAINS